MLVKHIFAYEQIVDLIKTENNTFGRLFPGYFKVA